MTRFSLGLLASFSIVIAIAACGSPEICDDGKDNDGDGKVDCADPDCAKDKHCVTTGGGEGEGEGAGEGEGEGGEGEGEGAGVETNCTDGIDNDDDGFFDCDDPDCAADPACLPAGETDCTNLQDDDSDGTQDCLNETDCIAGGHCTPGNTALNGPCTLQTDCQASAKGDPLCLRTQDRGYIGGSCSEYCSPSDACINGGFCVDIGIDADGTGICLQPCSADSECRDNTQICDVLARTGAQKVCLPAPVCGDGIFGLREECDDGNNTSGDGCSATCTLEACTANAFPALAIGSTSGDLGASTSHVFQGTCNLDANVGSPTNEDVRAFTPSGPGTLFLEVEGEDLALYVRHTCNDSSSELGCNSDFSNPTLTLPVNDEVFVVVDSAGSGSSSSYTLDAAFIPAACGDGLRAGSELCDGKDLGKAKCADTQPGTIGTLTCAATCDAISDAACVLPANATQEVEPNDTVPTAVNAYVDPFVGTFGSADDVDCVSVTATAGAEISAFFEDTGDGTCTFALDGSIAILDSTNTDLSSDFGCKTVVRAAVPTDGTYFVCIENFGTDGSTYHLVVDVAAPICGNGVIEGSEACDIFDLPSRFCESGDVTKFGRLSCASDCTLDQTGCQSVTFTEHEPNNTPATAEAFTSPYAAEIGAAGDHDCVSIAAGAGDHIRATTLDFGDGACAANLLDTEVEIFDTNGTTSLVDDDDSAAGFCSQAEAPAATTGTYFVCTRAHNGTDTFSYQLDIALLHAGCGGGFVDGTEECDDGNNVDGDGCSADCHVEECVSPKAAVVGSNAGNIAIGTDGVEACSSSFSRSFEEVWQFTPTTSGTVTVTAGSPTLDLVLDIRTTCGVDASSVSCTDNGANGDPETTTVTTVAGTPFFIVVEAYFGGDHGPYTLTIQ